MTIEGVIAQLQELIDNDGIPFWAKPSLQKVKETVKMEWEQHIKERKTGKWIPITGSQPETPGFYFVTYKDDDDRGNEFTDVTEGFWTGREWIKYFLKKLDVIAWMPKMEPYKEIEE